MKTLGVSLLSMVTILLYVQVATPQAKTSLTILLTCNKATIDSVYIPKIRAIVDWPDEDIRPYAKTLCKLDQQKLSYQSQIKTRADYLRSNNGRICSDLGFGFDPEDPGCKAAWANKINELIDHCITVGSIGHNPHNVGLLLDPAGIEVACLRGVNEALK